MAKVSRLDNTILILDNYREESTMLYKSFRQIGFKGPVLLLEDDGFINKDVICIYRYFCGYHTDVPTEKPRYFNQIEVPDYYEIKSTGTSGQVCDGAHERARIYYANPKNKRFVSIVDWLDDKGVVRLSDHYDHYGINYAKTIFDKQGKPVTKSYFDANGKECVVENYITKTILVYENDTMHMFRNKVELILHFLKVNGYDSYRIFYNSLSTPFFVTRCLPVRDKEDILFWQEGPRNDIPGNMKVIYEDMNSSTSKIYVQNKESYNNLIALGAPQDIVKPLGYIYPFERNAVYNNHALICTNSDRIEKMEELIQETKDVHFHIAAITQMSSKLLALSKYDNVSLYPVVKEDELTTLFTTCSIYLDINHEMEIVSSVKRAFLNHMVILGFKNTLHNERYIAKDCIYASDQYKDMVSTLQTLIKDTKAMKELCSKQEEYAMHEQKETYLNL